MKEKEIRTPKLNLLLCKLLIMEDGKAMLEFKNGKREERIPVETFIAEVNDFLQR